MKTHTLTAFTLSLTIACAAHSPSNIAPQLETTNVSDTAYPTAKRGNVIDSYHGVDVADPYRWFETPDTPEVKAFIDAQNALADAYFEGIPERAAMADRMESLLNVERIASPSFEGQYIYVEVNDGLQPQDILHRQIGLKGTREVVLDPNLFSEDQTVALAAYEFSPDKRFLAYAVSDGGSDWQTWKVRDLKTLKDLPDTLTWIKFQTVAWLPDGSGFYYARFPTPNDPLEQVNFNQRLYFHVVGQAQSEDTLVYAIPEHPDWGVGAEVSNDGSLLIITIDQGTARKNMIYTQSLKEANSPVVPLIEGWDGLYSLLATEGNDLYFRTTLNAPLGKIIKVPGLSPDRSTWTDIVPEAAETLSGAAGVGGVFLTRYLKDATALAKVFDTSGRFIRNVDLPGLGSLTDDSFGGGWKDAVTFYGYTSYNTPVTYFRYDLKTGESSPFTQRELAFEPKDFITTQVFYPSKDGTKIPMFISHHKDIKPNGALPTLLYGYGGFNISLSPKFRTSNLLWMEMGGVLAVANLRGGGEYGSKWHEAGTKLNKQNVFDDFFAAGEFLIQEGYTQSSKLAIHGGSNGGLLVGAALLQRPDLFAAALPAVGVLDMLRYHKFTIGWAWAPDYGTSEDDLEMFEAIYAYSPVHNAKPGTAYPATLITTGVRDDRVVPIHSYKFAAALQYAQSGPNPILLKVETRAGHGAGKPIQMVIDESVERLSFLVKELDFEPTLLGLE